ncbi:MBL fold metallo-hydrolase [Paenibacillus sp. CMAA1364]
MQTSIIILVSIVAVVSIVVYVVLRYYPSLGALSSKEMYDKDNSLPNYAKGKFINPIPTSMDTSFAGFLSMLVDFLRGNPNGRPDKPLPIDSQYPLRLQAEEDATITWFGHSTLFITLNGSTLLLDPMFGRAPSPFPWIGGKRYETVLPIELENIPVIDAVLLSHDHYDHLDYGSILTIKDRVKHFFVPLGVGAHLVRWGIPLEQITELNWWEHALYEGLTLVSTPARHFSGRRPLGNDKTLWCSWVIQGESQKIFFSGDSGYAPHFKDIGERYGPFDVTMMECGQYNERWAGIHMTPEETVQAQIDVRGKLMIPIHWGAFTLAFHDWTDPAERALKAAKDKRIAISTPRIGEQVRIGSSDYPTSTWWRN